MAVCRNPRCRDGLDTVWDHPFGLCPSCYFIGKVAFGLGAFIAGVLVAALTSKGWF